MYCIETVLAATVAFKDYKFKEWSIDGANILRQLDCNTFQVFRANISIMHDSQFIKYMESFSLLGNHVKNTENKTVKQIIDNVIIKRKILFPLMGAKKEVEKLSQDTKDAKKKAIAYKSQFSKSDEDVNVIKINRLEDQILSMKQKLDNTLKVYREGRNELIELEAKRRRLYENLVNMDDYPIL